jgi:hypothetical protein
MDARHTVFIHEPLELYNFPYDCQRLPIQVTSLLHTGEMVFVPLKHEISSGERPDPVVCLAHDIQVRRFFVRVVRPSLRLIVLPARLMPVHVNVCVSSG